MKSKNLKPIILIGFGRSGTSIIADIVLSHGKLAIISNYNAKYPQNKYINLIRLFFRNRIFNILGQKKQINKTAFINRFAFRNSEAYAFHNFVNNVDFGKGFLNDVNLSDSEVNEIRKKYTQIASYQLKERLGFKITGPSKIKYLNQIFPKAQFIYIERDPLPNIRSLLKVDFYQDRKHDLWWEGNQIYSKKELDFVNKNMNKPELIAALQYFKIKNNHQSEIKELGIENKVLTVKYEDFIAQPEIQIDRILKFTNLTRDNSIAKFMANNKIFNRNKKEEYYFSQTMDENVNKIAINGVT
ncbi:sulfotransferase [Winogradskyella bathintestinalis]|uniref:Sulfotransferase n=1 Tax=Winogradskyella bathintestinalis TaxID=3035208 RepID=A0ABT7ZSW1_9FLAO|nr:sulfotransferase [Winogradskyella bathintestinalis]MDN3492044.1 sulfotransferase [Winogradskyella bathintestinalis]